MTKIAPNKRIQWFHRTVLSNGYPNAPLLCKRFGISLSQAKRDIVFLRESLGAPLVYDGTRRGYRYDRAYSLPVAVTNTNDEEFSGLIATPVGSDYLTGAGAADEADVTFLQLQIPYTAELEIPDKLSVVELQPYIIRRLEIPGNKNIYKCEFRSVERFLGILFSLKSDVRVVSPEWLRERIISGAERILRLYRLYREDDN